MKRRTLIFIIIIGVILILAIGGIVYVLNRPSSGHQAVIYQDGIAIQTIDLDAVDTTYTLTITGDDGAWNTVSVQPGSIAITEASCPDKVCVRMGYIHNDSLPITCMPNHLVIRIEGTQNETALDALAH